MLRRQLLTVVLVLLAAVSAFAQKTKLQGTAEQSDVVVTVGVNSTTKAPRTFPLSTVTIKLAGTATLATLWTDAAGTTPKANPFTADANARWFAYVNPGAAYDITHSGVGIAVPFSITDVIPGGSGSDASTATKGITKLSVAPASSTNPIAVGDNDPRLPAAQSLYYADRYASLSVAVTAIGSTLATLVVSTPQTVSSSLSIPATLTLRREGAGTIAVNAGQTLTILGDIKDDSSGMMFTGSGIVSFANNVVLNTIRAEWFGVDYVAGTDDTTALQKAVTAGLTREESVIELPCVVMVVEGALQGPGGAQSRIRFSAPAGETGFQTIMLKGCTAPGQPFGTVPTTLNMPTAESIIKCPSAGGGACLGGSTAGAADFTRVVLLLEDLTVDTGDNPTSHAIDAGWMFGFRAKDVNVTSNRKYTFAVVEPTTATQYGIITPRRGNGADTRLDDVFVAGQYNGVMVNEHAILNNVNVSATKVALVFPVNDHASYIERVGIYNSQRALQFTGVHTAYIGQLNLEHASVALQPSTPAWQETVYDLDDASLVARGVIQSIRIVKAAFGAVAFDDNFLRNPSKTSYMRLKPIEGGYSVPNVIAHNSTNIAVPNSTLTSLTFNMDDQDGWDAHSTSTNTNRFNCKTSGMVTLTLSLAWEANATGYRQVILRKHTAGGSDVVIYADTRMAVTTATILTQQTLTALAGCSDNTEYFEWLVQQNSGGALNVEAQPYSLYATMIIHQ